MKLSHIIEKINCDLLTEPGPDPEITSCLASDMMSDVLAFSVPGALLITGLVNSQSVRTADVADAAAILYVRGKLPDEKTIELAGELDIPLLATQMTMFDVCGMLHCEGFEGAC